MGAARILLVDDDIDFRVAVKERLQSRFLVTEASDGSIAQTLLSTNQFDLVLSDIQMPNCNGLDLSDWIKRTRPTPIVLMTSFSHVLKTEDNVESVADAMLKKPFDQGELIRIIDRYLPKSPLSALGVEAQELESQFCKLSLEHFVSENGADASLYLRISPLKYIKVVHQGAKISSDRIKAYQEKNIHHVYVRKDEFSKVLQFNLLLTKAVKSSRISREKKVQFIKNTSDMILENVFIKGLDEESFHFAADFVSSGLAVITEHDETFELLEMFKKYDDYVYAHSLGVSVFSVMIGKAMGWKSISVLGKLATGGLFHDIGKKEISPELLKKGRHSLDHNERHMIESHTTRGREILQTLKVIPSDVIEIAYQHHEDGLGQGYPRQLVKAHIHPLARVVQIANIFCEHTIKSRADDEPVPPIEALRKIAYNSEKFEKETFLALCRLVREASQKGVFGLS